MIKRRERILDAGPEQYFECFFQVNFHVDLGSGCVMVLVALGEASTCSVVVTAAVAVPGGLPLLEHHVPPVTRQW